MVQVVRNADGQGYDADGHRDSQFDDHEDNHRQATADADHVVHEAGQHGQTTEESCHTIAVKDTPVWHVIEYQIKSVADDEEYSVNHQTHEGRAENPCLVVAAEYQGKHVSHLLESSHVCCHHSRKYLNDN